MTETPLLDQDVIDGLSEAIGTDGTRTGFEAFEPGTILVTPSADNIIRHELVSDMIGHIAPANGNRRRQATLILPDYAARVTVLDFDSFPTVAAEQLPLVKFRIKKTIPFDIESAAVSYFVQPSSGSKKVEVLAVTMAFDIVARYEALFRAAGFHPGEVTTSSLAALNLYKGDGVAVVAKLSGQVLTVTVLSGGTIKLFRCVMLEGSEDDELLAILHPTFAYVEDELASPVRKLILCGFPRGVPEELRCETENLRSRLGAPGEFNAGLLGYMESVVN